MAYFIHFQTGFTFSITIYLLTLIVVMTNVFLSSITAKTFYRIWLEIWIARRVSYKKQEVLTLREHLSSDRCFFFFFGEFVLLIILIFCVVLLCVFTFWVPCRDVRYEFCIKTRFGSSLPPVGYRKAHVLFTLFVFVHRGV